MAVAKTAAGERLIKRYENRKLYDPAARRYVTMTDLARMIARGDDVQVEDQKTGEDLTTVVLAQVVLESLKQRTAEVPRQVLTRLIRLGSAPFAAAGRRAAPLDAAARAREEAERIVSGLLSRGRLSLDEALALKQEITQSVQRLVTEGQRAFEARLHGLFEPGKGKDANASLENLRERLLTFETYLTTPGRMKAKRMRR
jgi:polyhydroxyalkanoate synthesis repressor PhaR